ncbi:methylated-DNA--[protein]-cysteine S-methyltransferase [Kangiella sp. TOML190]|uniref:methylated-DNA--[protein]-cysteine S-methyltransferase n=1 Tax=Kangiella sp. TOML190 TaxID=2931351 RepID=UPI00255A1503|nr:methylated-DNA--[protein]-cysteine S-methyltransferase [Kangiella sp. TOML190]
MTINYQQYPTPFGKVYIYADKSHIKALLFKPWQSSHAARAAQKETALIRLCQQQLQEYFNQQRQTFDLPIKAGGTEFQQQVWKKLTEIPYGKTWNYGQLASAIGNKNASRAVGAANGKNPISIIVPCHRVIGANGSLTGYAGGLKAKEWLLKHESMAKML